MSDQPSTMPSVTYAAGSRAACVKATVWLLIDRPLTDPLTLQAWAVIDGGGGADEVAGLMLSHGVGAAPDFAIAQTTPIGDVRFVFRGTIGVTGTSLGEDFTLAGRGILNEEIKAGVEHFLLAAVDEAPLTTVPVVAGVLPADGLGVLCAPANRTDLEEGAKPVVVSVPATAEEATAEEATAEEVTVEEVTGEEAAVEEATAPQAPDADTLSPDAAVGDGPTHDDPESLESIREYERLFGSPTSPVSSMDNRSAPDLLDQAEGVFAPDTDPADDQTAAPEHFAAEDTPDLPPWTAPVTAPDVVSSAVVSAPDASSDGFIDALPDFFGGPSTAAPMAQQSLPVVPPAPQVVPPAPDVVPLAPSAPSPLPAQAQLPTPPSPAEAPAVPAPQGRTVNRAQLQAAVPPPGPTVWAARCPLGHPSQAFAADCRVCGQPIPSQEPAEIPRPLLGRFLVPGGAPIPIDGDLILGRDPRPPEGGSTPAPRLVVLNDPRMEVSSQHASVTLNFWDVCLTDLGSTNGTEIVTPDGRRQRLAQHAPVTIQPGTKVIFAEVLELTFEATG